MSEGAVPGAPAAAPAASEDAAAPAAPVEGAAPVKVRSEDDDYNEFLKSRPLKYRAGGKEKSVTSAADLKRLLSRVDGTESAASESMKMRQEAESVKAKVASIRRLAPQERFAAMVEIFGERAVREAVESKYLAEDARHREQAQLSPEQRQLRAEREAFEQERRGFETQRQSQQREADEAAYVEKVNETYGRMERMTVAALTKAKISPDAVPQLLPFIAERLDRAERLGLGLDEEDLANDVVQEHDKMGQGWVSSKSAPDLADILEANGTANALMQEFARRIRAKVSGVVSSSPPVVRGAPQAARNTSDSIAEKIAAARTFGGQK